MQRNGMQRVESACVRVRLRGLYSHSNVLQLHISVRVRARICRAQVHAHGMRA